jgi:lipoprotein NlpI
MKRTQYTKYYLAASVALITFIVYLPALRNEFVQWDDDIYVFDNPYIHSFNMALFKWAFFDFYASNWHPLTWISHAIDYAVWGLNPMGHHLTSIILHAVNTFVIVLLITRLLASWQAGKLKSSHDTYFALIAAATTGLLFGLHPVHVESVAWIAERKDLLCALFFLLSIMAYTKYATPPILHLDKGRREEGVKGVTGKWYFLSLGFFMLALLSKPMAVTLPAVLLIMDWYPFERIRSLKAFRATFFEKLPFMALSIISSVLTILAQRSGSAIVSVGFVPLSIRVLVAAKSLLGYLRKMIWPLDLVPFYPYPGDVSLLSLNYLSAIAFVSGITVMCMVLAKKRKLWLSVWCYFFVTLFPVLGIVQVGSQSMADRYTYLPGLGPFLIMGLIMPRVSAKLNTVNRWDIVFKIICWVAAIFVFVFLSYLTIKQIRVWKNSIGLWSYVIEKENDKVPLAYNQRGMAFYHMGELDKAIHDYDRAIALNPSYVEFYNNRGMAFYDMGELDKAIHDYDRVIALNPSYTEAYNNRGVTFDKMGQFDKAIHDYDRAIALNPSFYKALINRGIAYSKAAIFDRAIESFNQCIDRYPYIAEVYVNRGITYAIIGETGSAAEDFNKAIALNPNLAVAYLNRGILSLRAGKKDIAISDFRKACDLGSRDGCERAALLMK